ncbi:M28 family metallopeptidase [Granulicella aggregans]|uniref:M28 family metallopeptidase n=1 Tax=Granulicella aggregans TaxID=474949 RepID=UPI0021DF80E7|nr:M28 family metallopeptidase [Granulicella aggregans]
MVSYRCRIVLVFVAFAFTMQQTQAQTGSYGAPILPAKADPAIAGALKQVSAERIHATIEKLVSFNNRSTLSSMETDLAPGTGVTAAADWIAAEFGRISADCGGCLEVKRDTFTEPGSDAPNSRIRKPTTLTNVYAVLKGADPAQAARRVLVTGHYDSRNSDNFNTHDAAPGANDDASGVAVSIECARVLSKLKFPSTIVFVAVAGEEQGLNGSRHLAKLAKAEGWQLEAVLNNDIVGGDTTPGQAEVEDKTAVRVFSEGVPSPGIFEGSADKSADVLRQIHGLGSDSDAPSRELARAMVDVDHTYFPESGIHTKHFTATVTTKEPFHPVMIFRADRYLRGGDHTSFNLEGFTAVRITEWRENFDHQHQNIRVENGVQYGDLLKYVDFDYVANVARLNAATLATLASAPGVPQNVHILTAALDNNTELAWEAPLGASANTAYEVVWRATELPDWTTFVSAGTKTTIKLPVSKDNVVFGVRSVDAAGHRSIAVLPMPARK